MRNWTKDEIEFVRTNLVSMKYRDIAKALNRTRKSVLRCIQNKFAAAQKRERENLIQKEVAHLRETERFTSEIKNEIERRLGFLVSTNKIAKYRRFGKLPAELADQIRARGLAKAKSLDAQSTRRQWGEIGRDIVRQKDGEYAAASGWPEYITPGQVRVLNAFALNGPLTKRDLMQLVGIAFKTAERVISNLTKQGVLVDFGSVRVGTPHLYFISWEWFHNVRKEARPLRTATASRGDSGEHPRHAGSGVRSHGDEGGSHRQHR